MGLVHYLRPPQNKSPPWTMVMPRIPRGFQSASRSPSPRFALCLSACPSRQGWGTRGRRRSRKHEPRGRLRGIFFYASAFVFYVRRACVGLFPSVSIFLHPLICVRVCGFVFVCVRSAACLCFFFWPAGVCRYACMSVSVCVRAFFILFVLVF